MTRILIFTLVLTLILCINCKTFDVKTSLELETAIESVAPGDMIHLAEGKYHGKFMAKKSGSIGSPITLMGKRNATLSGTIMGFGFFKNTSYWVLSGFTIADSPMGIVFSGAHHNIVDDLMIRDIEFEGIQIRDNSTDNIVRNTHIVNTAMDKLNKTGTGGIVIGSDMKEWTDNKTDTSDRNRILNNKIGPAVGGFHIQAKEGTNDGLIEGNWLDGSLDGVHRNILLNWIVVKGNGYTVDKNNGTNSITDGIQIISVDGVKMSGCNNKIQNNNCTGVPAGAQCAQDNSKNCVQKNIVKNNVEVD